MSNIADRAFIKVEHLLSRGKLSTAEKRIRFYIGVSNNIVSFGLFSFIYSRKFALEERFGASDTLDIVTRTVDRGFWLDTLSLFEEQWIVILLALFTYIWYYRYNNAVKNEMDIVMRTYSGFNPPSNWESVVGMRWVPFLSVGLTLVFLALAWSIDHLPLYCLFVVLMNVMDMRGNAMVRANLIAHFADARFVPPDTDQHRDFIMRRREVAAKYWIARPHLERIGLLMVAIMVAFLAYFSGEIFGLYLPKEVPYLVVMAAIIANEATMFRWRGIRDRALDDIERAQEEANRQRSQEPAVRPA
jgi:hypothetical protein